MSLAMTAAVDEGPTSIAARVAPVIASWDSDTVEPVITTAVPSGVAASPTIRNPSTAASCTSVATIAAAASGADPGSRRTTS